MSRVRFACRMASLLPSQAKRSSIKPLVFLLLLLIVLFNVKLLWVTKDRILEGYGDFSSFYTSALIVKGGRGTELYNYQTQREFQRPLFSTVQTREDALPWVHLAYETLIYIPFTSFSYPTAVSLWTIVNILLLGVISFLLPFYFARPKLIFGISLMLFMLASFPVLVTLIQGQDCIVLLVLYTLAFSCLKKGRPGLAGFVLAFGLFKFLLVLPFVGVFLLQRQWRFVTGFVASSIIPIAVSVYIAGIGGTWEYLRFLGQFSQSPTVQFEIEPSKMPNLRGLIYSLLSRAFSTKYLLITTIVVSVALMGWAAISSRWYSLELRFALAMLVSLAVSYYLFVYDLTLAVLPLAITMNQMSFASDKISRVFSAAFAGLCILLLTSPFHLTILFLGIAASLIALPLLGLIFLTSKQPASNLAIDTAAGQELLSGDAVL